MSTLSDPHRRWDTNQQAIDHYLDRGPRPVQDIDFSRASMFARDRTPAPAIGTGGKENAMFGLFGSRKDGVTALKVALFAGQVVEALATADANGDGNLSPQEIAETAAELVTASADAFPSLANLRGSPEKLKEATQLMTRFVVLVTEE